MFRDKNKVKVVPGDLVEFDGKKFEVKFIESYTMATEVIVENLDTHRMETLLLRDIKKI